MRKEQVPRDAVWVGQVSEERDMDTQIAWGETDRVPGPEPRVEGTTEESDVKPPPVHATRTMGRSGERGVRTTWLRVGAQGLVSGHWTVVWGALLPQFFILNWPYRLSTPSFFPTSASRNRPSGRSELIPNTVHRHLRFAPKPIEMNRKISFYFKGVLIRLLDCKGRGTEAVLKYIIQQ